MYNRKHDVMLTSLIFYRYSLFTKGYTMKKFAILACVLFSACSLSEEKFETDAKTESCRLIAECAPEVMELAGWEDQAACEAAEDEGSNEGCTYDAAKAQECLDALKSADCDAFSSGDYASSCEGVYTCDTEEAGDTAE